MIYCFIIGVCGVFKMVVIFFIKNKDDVLVVQCWNLIGCNIVCSYYIICF